MTINSPVEYCNGLWDWAILNGCFGDTRIAPTDIDGFVERHGKFLAIETKAPGVQIPYGQMLTFEALLRTGVFTIVVVWGTTDSPEYIQVMTRKKVHEQQPCSLERLRNIVSQWFTYADNS